MSDPKALARKFVRANDESPVVAGRAIGEGGKGGVYTLENGNRYPLTVEACRLLPDGYPKWKLT